MVGTKGGFTFLASKAFQSISCKINQPQFSFPSLLLCVLRNITSLYSPWRSDAFSHPQHLSLQRQDAALDFFVAAEKTCMISVQKFRERGGMREAESYCVRASTKMDSDPKESLGPQRSGRWRFSFTQVKWQQCSSSTTPAAVQLRAARERAGTDCRSVGLRLGAWSDRWVWC